MTPNEIQRSDSDRQLESQLAVLGELTDFNAPIGSTTDVDHAVDADPEFGDSVGSARISRLGSSPRPYRSLLPSLAAAVLLGLTIWLVADPALSPTILSPRTPDLASDSGSAGFGVPGVGVASLDRSPLTASAGPSASDLAPTDDSLVQVAHVPSNVDKGPRVDLFALSSTKDRAVLVLVRGWERGCRCVEWHYPEGLESPEIFRGTVQPGQDLMVEVDVTGDPPIEQHLVIVTADDPALLAIIQRDTEEFFCCLENQPRSGATGDAAEFCLPNGVAVVTQPFTVD